MISAEEAVGAFDVLADSLRERGYTWILDQIDETLNLGKMKPSKAIDFTVDEDVEARYVIARPQRPSLESDPRQASKKGPNKKPKGRPVDIERVEPFTPHERLNLLLDAVERVFVASEKMERVTIERFGRIDSERTREIVIDFQAEAGERARSVAPSAQRSQSVESLSSLLEMLHEAVQ
jgi:hypothetical protein